MSDDPTIDWRQEATLDPALVCERPPDPSRQPSRVLVTGATGLLGAFLLDELLRETDARVECLVRAPTHAAADARLRGHCEALGLDTRAFAQRVVALAGELEAPLLGLGEARFARLADEVDAIFHAAAAIHFLRAYASMRATNVGGTESVLRLATRGRCKVVHHVSSLAVFFGREREQISELDEPDIDSLSTGYAQSKWVAEQLVHAAGRRGLPVVIYRAGRIAGHSQTGATCAWQDLAMRLLKACVVLGAYPSWDIEFGLAPVDFVSRAILHIARQPEAWGRCFHLSDPRPIRWLELMGRVEAHGYPMVALDHARWLARLKQVAADGHPERDSLARLWMALASGRAMLQPQPRLVLPNSTAVLGGSNIACPRIDAGTIERYLGYLVSVGYLPAPAQT